MPTKGQREAGGPLTLLRTPLGSPRSLALKLHTPIRRRWTFSMLAAAIAGILIVFALFLSMLSSSPKDDPKWKTDTEAGPLVTPEEPSA